MLLEREAIPILLIHSGKFERYWDYVDTIQREQPEKEMIPEYYRKDSDLFKTWFRVKRFEIAERNVMGKCKVASSKALLSTVSKASMSPYFIIEYDEDGE